MGVSKVIYGNRTVMDITDSTVTANNLLSGAKAYGADGEPVTGAVVVGAQKVFYGACTTSGSSRTKTATISSDQGFALSTGVVIYIRFTNANTYNVESGDSITLDVNSTGAKTIVYAGETSPTGVSTKYYGAEKYTNCYIYDGTYWVWQGSTVDSNTTYSNRAEAQGGTQTSLVTTGDKYNWNRKLSDNPTFTEASTRSNIISGESLATILGKIKKFFSDLKAVAFSGSYNDLSDTPTIPTVNNATLTIQKNGATVETFTANASSNKTANITVPTKVSDLTNDSGFVTTDEKVKQVDATSSDTSSLRVLFAKDVWTQDKSTVTDTVKKDGGLTYTPSEGRLYVGGQVRISKNTVASSDDPNVTVDEPSQIHLRTIDVTDPNNTLTNNSYIRAYSPHTGTGGNHIVVNAGGGLILGGGESGTNLYSAIKNAQTDPTKLSLESTYISADTSLTLYSNCNTIANRVGFRLTTSHEFIPYVGADATTDVGKIGTSTYKVAEVNAVDVNTTNINGVAVGATPAFTDTKVTQTVTTSSNYYRVLLSGTNDGTTRTEGARKTNKISFSPGGTKLQVQDNVTSETASSPSYIAIGNATPKNGTNTNCSHGVLQIYGRKQFYGYFYDRKLNSDTGNLTDNRNYWMPDKSGFLQVGYEFESTQTLSTSTTTTFTFTSTDITANMALDVYSSIYGFNPTSATLASGSCTVVFPKYTSAESLTCRICVKP